MFNWFVIITGRMFFFTGQQSVYLRMLLEWSFQWNDYGWRKEQWLFTYFMSTHRYKRIDGVHCDLRLNLNVFAILLSRLHFEIQENAARAYDVTRLLWQQQSPCLFTWWLWELRHAVGTIFFTNLSLHQSIPLVVADFASVLCMLAGWLAACVCFRKWVHLYVQCSWHEYNRQTNVYTRHFTNATCVSAFLFLLIRKFIDLFDGKSWECYVDPSKKHFDGIFVQSKFFIFVKIKSNG